MLVKHFISFLQRVKQIKNNKRTNVGFYLSHDIKITLKSSYFYRKNSMICHYVRNGVMDVITFHENL